MFMEKHKKIMFSCYDIKTYMTNNDFMSARNSGTPPVKLLFDKSLTFETSNSF